MITELEFMCSYYCGIYTEHLCRLHTAATVYKLFCLSKCLITGCVFSEFGCVTNIHISTGVHRLYKRRLSKPSRCGACLDIVVSCGLLKECYCGEHSFVFHAEQRMWYLAHDQTQRRSIYFYHHSQRELPKMFVWTPDEVIDVNTELGIKDRR